MSALTKAQMAEARILKAQGETNERIAAHYGVEVSDLPEGFVPEPEPEAKAELKATKPASAPTPATPPTP